MIYHSRFASELPFRTPPSKEYELEDLRRWRERFTNRDLFRSNIVKLALAERKTDVEQGAEKAKELPPDRDTFTARSTRPVAHSAAEDTQLTLRPEVPLSRRTLKGKATIRVDRPAVPVGTFIELEMEFFNTGNSFRFYNPFLEPKIPPSARLAVFDASGRYVGSVLGGDEPEAEEPVARNWVFIRYRSFIGRRFKFAAGKVLGADGDERQLPPGKYRLQMIFHSRFVSTCPFLSRSVIIAGSAEQALRAWREDFSDPNQFRSNVVEIELLGGERRQPPVSD
jgi:hypothetical protein